MTRQDIVARVRHLAAAGRQAATAVVLFRRTMGLLWAASPARAMVYLLLILIAGLIPVGVAWLSKLVLDRVGLALLHRGDAALAGSAFTAAVWFVGLQFAGRMVAVIQQPVQANLSTLVSGHVDRRLMQVAASIPDLDHFERTEFQDEIALVQRMGGLQPIMLLQLMQSVGWMAISAIGSLALLWRLQPLLPLALLLCAVPLIAVQARQVGQMYRSMSDRSETWRRMGYYSGITTDSGAAKDLLISGAGPWFYQRWRQLAQETLTEQARLRRAALLANIAGIALGAVLLAGGYAYVAAQVGGHRLTIGDFALYLTVIASLQRNMYGLAANAGLCYGRLLWMRRVFAFLDDTRPSIAVAPPGAGLPAPARFREGLELRGVSFTYPGQDQPVLRGITCTLGAGETVALVGENGAGKTTLVKLLTRLYDPTSGAILLDGLPIAQYDLAGLRLRVSALFQDFAHFAQHNIGVGDAAHADDRPAVLAAARWAGADTVLAKLPDGLDTSLTRTFAGGVDLSGGEWQKVATARAAMRDAALVILDEPTAALDAQAESELFGRFRELAEGRTVLLISHRFSTVRMADRVLVLENGHIVEQGSHEELIAAGGRYATLYELQAGRYRD